MNDESLTLPSPTFVVTKKFWIGLAIALWVFFVIANIPAVWGAYLMARTGAIGLSGVTGTIWSGQASLASVKVKQVDYSIGQLRWNISVFSLLLLKPCANIKTEMDNQQFDGQVCMDFKGVLHVNDADFNFPAALIQPKMPLPVDGKFSVHIDTLKVQGQQLNNLHGKVSWLNVKVFNGSTWMVLGGFGADVADDGKAGVSAHIFDVDSPMHLDANLALLSPSGGSLKGTLSVTEAFNREAKLNDWLSVFATQGAPDAQGNIQYTIDTNL